MAQIAKIIDITRSFIPVDPNAFASNMMYPVQEDTPEKPLPILAYEGYNFLPTPYGYRSFFGTNSKLDVAALPSRCNKVLMFQLANRQNILIALCEDGIYTQLGTEAGQAWIRQVAQTAPPVGVYLEWTYALIENTLYFYRQGTQLVHVLAYDNVSKEFIDGAGVARILGSVKVVAAPVLTLTTRSSFTNGGKTVTAVNHTTSIVTTTTTTTLTKVTTYLNTSYSTVIVTTTVEAGVPDIVYTSDPTNIYTVEGVSTSIDILPGTAPVRSADIVAIAFTSFTPTFLNMEGQMGIFRANGRLGFWDSANSVSWSDLFDIKEFSPDAREGTGTAGYSIFNSVVGRIVQILSQEEGFTIYCTKSIVGVRYSSSVVDIPWESSSISSVAGIFYPSQVVHGLTESEHFAFTSAGILKIGEFNALSKSHKMEEILVDVYDLLKESRTPVALEMMNGRFLCFLLADNNYIDGQTSHESAVVSDLLLTLAGSSAAPIDVAGVFIEGYSFTAHIAKVVLETRIPVLTTTYEDEEIYINGTDAYENTLSYVDYRTGVIQVPGVGTGTIAIDAGADGNDIIELPGDIEGGFFSGLYTEWRASGTAMVPSRDPSAIKPYTKDVNSVHIDNTPIVLTSQASALYIENITRGISNYGDEVPAQYPAGNPNTLALGWTFPGLNRVSSDYLGNTDVHLNHFIATQVKEWHNFELIQVATKNAFLAATSIVGSLFSYSTAYTSIAGAQSVIDNLHRPAHVAPGDAGNRTIGGSGNTWWHESDCGKIQDSITTTQNIAVISGAGSSFATMLVDVDFIGGWQIRRRVTRTWTIRAGAVNSGYWVRVFGGGLPFLQAVYEFIGTTSFTASRAQVISMMPPAGTTGSVEGGNLREYINLRANPINDYQAMYSRNLNGGPFEDYFLNGDKYTITPYYIDYQDTFSLSLTYLPELTLHSEATASQTSLSWGYSTPATPENTYTSEGEFLPLNDGSPNIYMGTEGQPGSSEVFSDSTTWAGIPGRWVTFTRAIITLGWEPGVSIEANSGYTQTFTYPSVTIPGIHIPGYSFPDANFTFPGAKFLLQKGTPRPIYPDYQGFLCLDISLKKWGKCKAAFRALVDYQPLNNQDAGVVYTNFGTDMGMLSSIGEIKIFDAKPAASYIRYGKIGLYRLGMTQLHEVTVNFRLTSTGMIEVDSSVDGRLLSPNLKSQTPFTSALEVTAYLSQIGKWHTIKISGNYDLQFIEVTGTIASRR